MRPIVSTILAASAVAFAGTAALAQAQAPATPPAGGTPDVMPFDLPYGQSIGLEEEQDSIWRINFMDLDLGFLDEQTMKFTPISPEESFQRISSPSRENS